MFVERDSTVQTKICYVFLLRHLLYTRVYGDQVVSLLQAYKRLLKRRDQEDYIGDFHQQ